MESERTSPATKNNGSMLWSENWIDVQENTPKSQGRNQPQHAIKQPKNHCQTKPIHPDRYHLPLSLLLAWDSYITKKDQPIFKIWWNQLLSTAED